MREEDRKAFVDEYLELCRKYGLGLIIDEDFIGEPDLYLCQVNENYLNQIKERLI